MQNSETPMPSEENGTLENDFQYDELLERIGFGRTQWLLLLISGLLTITSISAQQSMGIIVIASQCEFETSQAAKGLMMAACVAGVFLSTYFWGYISDAVGRRTVLLIGVFASSVIQLVLMFVTNVWLFNILNFLVGISLGGVSGALYAYLGEFNIPRHRAIVINYSTMFVSVAAIYIPVMSWLVLSTNWSINIVGSFVFRPWRLIILTNLLPGLIGGLLLLPYPESPKLLLAQNKAAEAIEAVKWISKTNTGNSLLSILNCAHIIIKPEVSGEQENMFTNRNICGVLVDIVRAAFALFKKPHGWHFTICNLVVFGMFFSSNGMQYWFPEIVNRSSSTSSANSSTICSILNNSFKNQQIQSTELMICDDSISTKTYVDNIIVGVAFLIGFSIQGTLLNPFGRKNVLLAALVLSALSGVSLHFVTNKNVILILFCLYILLPGLSISIMLGVLVDLMPTHLRGKAVSLCMTLGRFGIILAANLMAIFLEKNCDATFGLFTMSILGCIILVHLLTINKSI